ncbi:ribosome maturation protein RimP [Rhodococcus sp. IEGM 1408]|uniref:ribosome maturation factor RimP n=1 Tax=Rhodococcus sp. IEGM 1408 TaxID=3082220 RepID=UPI00295527B9|nr:ribosome maturation protein RimP [Rhodococcus sp. IEGM 1408]MDV8000427.1 ribosome maturation protein RimP [Rhodococcus sp. IEGM 1408]
MIVPESDRAHIRTAVAERGLELEEIREDSAATTWHVTVVVDGDTGVTLDHLAELSIELDGIAEQWGGPDRAVTFEVTSRGVDAPLSEPRHWRRARGRQVELSYVEGVDGPTQGRVGDLDEASGTVRLVTRSGRGMRVNSVALSEVARAVIRVEFRPAPEGELALLSDPENPGRGVQEGEEN